MRAFFAAIGRCGAFDTMAEKGTIRAGRARMGDFRQAPGEVSVFIDKLDFYGRLFGLAEIIQLKQWYCGGLPFNLGQMRLCPE